MSITINKLAKRYAQGLCTGCGKSPCKCKTRGKPRNRIKGIGRNEAKEPSLTMIAHVAKTRLPE